MYSKIDLVNISKKMFDEAGIEVVPYNDEKDFSKEEVQEVTGSVQKMLKRFSV